MATYTQQQLDECWASYIKFSLEGTIDEYLSPNDSGNYSPEFSAMFGFIFKNRLYGFADADSAGRQMYATNSDGWKGPIRS
jgi:hypothetical protein